MGGGRRGGGREAGRGRLRGGEKGERKIMELSGISIFYIDQPTCVCVCVVCACVCMWGGGVAGVYLCTAQ